VLRGVEIHADVILKGTRVMVFMTQIRRKNWSSQIWFHFIWGFLKGLNVMDTNCYFKSREQTANCYFDMNKIGNLEKFVLRKYRYSSKYIINLKSIIKKSKEIKE
jgi:uridylate kinase